MQLFVQGSWARCLAVIALAVQAASGAGLSPQIPSVASFIPATSTSSFVLSPNTRIIVDSGYGDKGTPSALDFAKIFRNDLASVTSYSKLPQVDLSHGAGTQSSPTIHVVVDPSLNYTLFNGKETDEGYDLLIEPDTVQLKASAAIGAWRGMTTLVQQAALAVASGAHISFPLGQVTDTPGWEIRGFMLDAGRHWYTTQFLSECREASCIMLCDH